MEPLIQWAQQTITTRAPHFHFQHANVFNKYYNSAGTVHASEFGFPFPGRSFDLAFLPSVFTHMLADDLWRYLDELYRVIKPGGRLFATCFLMNAESRELISAGKSTQNLIHPLVDCCTTNVEVTEDVIGYDEELLPGWIDERGFKPRGKYYGSWCGRKQFLTYQDVLVYQKKRVHWPKIRARVLEEPVRSVRRVLYGDR